MNFKNGVKKIQAAAYNGARTVNCYEKFSMHRNRKMNLQKGISPNLGITYQIAKVSTSNTYHKYLLASLLQYLPTYTTRMCQTWAKKLPLNGVCGYFSLSKLPKCENYFSKMQLCLQTFKDFDKSCFALCALIFSSRAPLD